MATDNTLDFFKNGSKQGALWEVEELIKLIEECKADPEISDINEAYEFILYRLKLRQKELMKNLNWKEV